MPPKCVFPSVQLLNIAYMTIGGYPNQVPEAYLIPERVFKSTVDFPRFKNIAPGMKLSTYSLCGGAITDDFDNDGLLDVVASTWSSNGQLRIFHNNGDGNFAGRTGKSGLLGLYGGLNLLSADYNNDGNLDILVLRGAWLGARGQYPNSLLKNNGDGTFTDVTFKAGLATPLYPTQTAGWADYDNDGYLDLLRAIVSLDLVESVAPIQLAIRLLVPRGSGLIPVMREQGRLGRYDDEALCYRWRADDPAVDRLQADLMMEIEVVESKGLGRGELFERIA